MGYQQAMTVPEDVPVSNMCNMLILQFHPLGSPGRVLHFCFLVGRFVPGRFFSSKYSCFLLCSLRIFRLFACSCFPGHLLILLPWGDAAVTCLLLGSLLPESLPALLQLLCC